MNDLISRSAVLEEARSLESLDSLSHYANVFVVDVDDIKNLPTVDAVPVVRCGECVCRSEYGICYKHGHSVADEFFCAYGTREKPEKKAAKQAAKSGADICMATGQACFRCVTGPCDRRKEAKV